MRKDIDYWEKSYRSNFEGSIGYNDRPNRKRKFDVRNRLLLERMEKSFSRLSPMAIKPKEESSLEIVRKFREDNLGIKGSQTTIDSGFVYIIENPAWPDWLKIGETIDYENRLRSYQTSSPLSDFRICLTWYVEDRKKVEKEILDKLSSLNFEIKGEWVKIDKKMLFDILK